MKGRITEKQLPLAEESCPGITKIYKTMKQKPATFLDLLWHYEGLRNKSEACTAKTAKHSEAKTGARIARGTGILAAVAVASDDK